MKPLEEARAEVLGSVGPLGTEEVDLAEAGGRILAEPVIASHDLPPFPNSAMDGYAVLADDLAQVPVRLQVVEDVPAGSVATRPVTRGTAIKIMTGAPMPEGADTVVKVEVTHQPDAGTVVIEEAVPKGTAVRPAGGDVKAGEEVLQAGVFLGPPEVALLASLGVQRPVVGKRPVVTVFSTGDELRPADTITLGPGQIRDSNRPMMLRLVAEAGGEAVDGGIVADTEDDLVEALEQAAAASDAILTSGGVSMGEYDLIKRVMAERGNVEFWQVAMQPAKPFAFGFVGKTPLFGLPGNPVSVMVAFEQFARPALLAMQGASRLLRPRIRVVAGERFETDPEKEVFLRVAFDQDGEQTVVRSSGGQSSNVLSALAAADGFAVVPVGVDVVERGEMVEVELFRSPPSRRPS